MLLDTEILVREILSSDWHINIHQDPMNSEYKIQVVTFISLDKKEKISAEKMIDSVVDRFVNTDLVQSKLEHSEKIISQLNTQIAELTRYKTYYDMHKNMIGKN